MWRNSNGETLIEVTLAAAILCLVIVISYGVANASVQTSIQSRERIQAIHIAQQQADRLIVKRDSLASTAAPATHIVGPSSAMACSGNCSIDSTLAISASASSCATVLSGCTALFRAQADLAWSAHTNEYAHYIVEVKWNGVNNSPQTSSVDVILVDKRVINQTDCSEAKNCT